MCCDGSSSGDADSRSGSGACADSGGNLGNSTTGGNTGDGRFVVTITVPIIDGNTLITLAFHAFVRLIAFQTLLVVWKRALYWGGAIFNISALFGTGSCQRCASRGVLCLQGALADAVDAIKVVPTTFGLACSSGARASS